MAEELYTGPKFETIFLSSEPPEHHGLSKLMNWCSVFHQKKLAPAHENGTAGNLSFRLKPGNNSFCITAAGLLAKCKLSKNDFVIVENFNLHSKKIFARGIRQPSSESMMHWMIYQTLPNVSAVFHGHHQELLDNAEKLQLPVTEKACEYGSADLIDSILPMLGKFDFFLINEHGFLSLGENMEDAGSKAVKNVLEI